MTESRQSSLCPYFGECGGCQMQDVPYAGQVRLKGAQLAELFAPFWDGPVEVTPSPVRWHYRNKVDPAFAPKRYDEPPPPGFERETVLGFKRKGRWFWPLDIAECRIGPEGLAELLAAVRAWYRAAGLRAFDSRTGDGFLRVLLVRDAKATGERMVALITRPGEFDAGPFVEAVRTSFRADSIYHGVFHGLADVAAADELTLLDGKPAITERLTIPDTEGAPVELAFRISPFSFFQTNPRATQLLYGEVRAWVRRTRPRVLYDLYGGMGGIAFSCADLVERVWSVENVPEASEDGRHNAGVNGIGNVEFITGKVKNYLRAREQGDGLAPDSAVVVDPPRAGLHPKALKRLVALAPPHLFYVSCNPKLLAREMPALLESYRLDRLSAVDLFPHTRHVEAVAAFSRR